VHAHRPTDDAAVYPAYGETYCAPQQPAFHSAVGATHREPVWTTQQRPYSTAKRGAHINAVDTALCEAVIAAECQTVRATFDAAYCGANILSQRAALLSPLGSAQFATDIETVVAAVWAAIDTTKCPTISTAQCGPVKSAHRSAVRVPEQSAYCTTQRSSELSTLQLTGIPPQCAAHRAPVRSAVVATYRTAFLCSVNATHIAAIELSLSAAHSAALPAAD
jgi:hypothetical protein